MALISLKCTNCGGELQADNTWNSVVCPYCRATFAVVPDVNNYNTTNNINANVVNITYNITQQAPPERENSNPKQSNSDFIIEDNVLKAYTGHSSIVNIPYGVIEIAAECFMGRCGISKITIPDTVIKIGTQAFKNCIDLKEIVAAPRLKKMYSDIFESGIGATNKAVDLNKSYSQQSSYSNKSNSLTYRTQSGTYNPTYKPSPSKSVAKEYVKDHPEQYEKDKKENKSNKASFLDILSAIFLAIMDNPKGETIIKWIVAILAMCPVWTLMILVQGNDFEGVEIIPIISVIEIIIGIIWWIDHMIKK